MSGGPIRRYSTRQDRIDTTVLTNELENARRYDRIAGYFTSSLFEIAGEQLARIGQVRIVCNADVSGDDLQVAKNREAALLGRLHNDPGLESLLRQDRYRLLDEFLQAHPDAIRVVPNEVCGLIHGKAGVIERADGNRLAFIGSMNETRMGWKGNYEILWSDESNEGADWVQSEFDWLWERSHPLPRVVLQEIHRRSKRTEVAIEDIEDPEDVGPAAVVESPMYQEGFSLSPWQRAFVSEALKHKEWFGVARLLLADEVGLGKTLSLATATIVLALQSHANPDRAKRRRSRPIAIFAPATLTEQWQVELIDKLGVSIGRWSSFHKAWIDPQGHIVSPKGAEQIARCPFRIGVISTGLLSQPTQEREILENLEFETVVLDESHKARERQGAGPDAGEPNVLLQHARRFAQQADNVLLGTATPMQTEISDLWGQLGVLHQGRGRFVLGNDFSPWHKPDRVIPLLTGAEQPTDVDEAWNYLRSPIPPTESSPFPSYRLMNEKIRRDLEMREGDFDPPRNASRADLEIDTQETIEDELERREQGTTFFQRHNPIVRHVVLRKRADLEEKGLLQKVGVVLHPDPQRVDDESGFFALFEGKALRTRDAFDNAYEAANRFGTAYGRRKQAAGFMTNLMRQRLCSSPYAARSTAEKLLQEGEVEEDLLEEDEAGEIDIPTDEEREALHELIRQVDQLSGEDPKVSAVRYYLDVEGWAEHGCIIFSQYYDTAEWIARQVAAMFPSDPVGLYAGAGKSRLFRGEQSSTADRENLKRMVKEREIRLMVATDAAGEGLNLQTLGTLINIDLPWNPVKLEQRIGRIKRFGQTRANVDMLNLVYQDTVDATIYERLSERMQDRYDLFGSLPDTIEDEWIEDEAKLAQEMDKRIENRKKVNGFDLRYNDSVLEGGDDPWRDCVQVLSRQDIEEVMRSGW
ncbi:phospholipase D-like domain-containing anti-phage protein [Thioalkalivibrio sp. ALE23]|uniref:phospholipase D-like domain-containing anti-phage protein n=1 Tax=Thioalkalivibrio sp. ALE23 TaxID=1265495 RepID=UPI000374F95D|nr:phospholipase D-like domain-containing anti-phage protein [Thioalkalivibrio sp. ALE23]